MGRQRCIISKKFLSHENGRKQDPHKRTWEFKPLHVIILLSSSHKYVYTHTRTYIHTYIHTYLHCIKVDYGNSEMWGMIMGTEF